MHSASVIIETPVPAGKQPTQGGEQSSTRGGLFDSELKQQQQQIDAQRSSDTNSSAKAKGGSEENTKTQETASNKQQNQTDSQQNNTESAPNESSAKAGESELSHSKSETVVATPDAAEEGAGELDKAAVIAILNKSLKGKTVEAPADENSTESAVLSVTEGDIEQEVVTLDTATPSESDSEIIEQSGNKLPLEPQNELLVESDETIQPVSMEEGASAHVRNAQQPKPNDEMVKDELALGDNDSEVGIKSDGGKRTSNEDNLKNTGQAAATVNNEPELEVTNALKVSEVVPQVVVSAPSTTSPAPVTSTAASNQVGQTSSLAAAVSVASNASAGQGMGNSDSSGSMAGRQPMATPEMKPLMTEGETKQTTDKTADFLSTLKSISKDGVKGADVSVQVQNGTKPQPQISQLVSQLSSVQSTGQTQGATSASAAVSSVESTPAMMTIATSMRQQGWDRAMGERLVFMARNGIQEAKVQVNPRNMGPVEIKISVNPEQQTNVSFVTTNAAARETIDAAMPRLREMFDQAGLNLAESEVSQRDNQRNEQSESAGDEDGSNELVANGQEGEQEENIHRQVGYVQPAGLDLFA